MTSMADRRREISGWIASILLHTCLLSMGAALVLRPAEYHVDPGKTSTQIEFAVEMPSAVPVPPVPAPISSRPPTIQSVQVPDEIIPPAPKPVESSPSPPPPVSQTSAKSHVAKAVPKPSAVHRQEESIASKGAIQAQPDDLHNEPPEYPEESKAAGEQGVVILRVGVTADGQPASVNILRSSGYFHLDQAARRAVLHWKFHPGMMAGIPTSSAADVPVRFKLQ